MPIRPICITGEPVLHTPAKEVETFDDELRELVADMFETMDEAPGVGLAAPQIGVGLRIFTYDYPDEEGNERRGVVINPVLEVGAISEDAPDEETEIEGCLSLPGERFPLKRAERAIITGLDLEKNKVLIEATGWFARIFQHEFDHLNGILYVDRLVEPWKEISTDIIADNGWGKAGVSWLPGRDNLESEQ